MAFWGIEVKPCKPVVHSCEKARGRLRISQATLGIGGATEKSIIQCNVGNRSPVLLCVLLPNQTESCHLELEFEEADDVTFSVIGPRSVYLTGYYVCKNQQSNPHSDTESYGVDIENSQTEESNYCSDDDKYEDSFIDDDELQVRSTPPVSSSKVADKTTPEDDNMENRNVRGKRLKKKSQVVESDDDVNSRESEDEDGYLLSIFKSKNAKLENGCSTKSKEKVDLVDAHGNPEREKPSKKRKERPKEEKTFEVQIDNEQKVEASAIMGNGDNCLLPAPEPGSGNGKRTKKRKKELPPEGTLTEGIDNAGKDCKPEQDLLNADNTMNETLAENRDQKQEGDNNISVKPELLVNASQPEKKTKKKKNKKTQGEGDSGSGMTNTTGNQENTSVRFENQSTNEKPIKSRTLSNGLIIEEVANGPPDGKVAVLGKKVKIYYTAMNENGHVFDSNVGKTACKFRLGDEGITDGWDLGIDGMHVGDKRKIIIPPSMGFGKHVAAENVPPNSWIVCGVELVGVRK